MFNTKRDNNSYETTIQRWGNSQGIRLKREVLNKAGFEVNDTTLKIEIEPNRISLVPKDNLTPFQKLFNGYDSGKPESDLVWEEADPVGKEEW